VGVAATASVEGAAVGVAAVSAPQALQKTASAGSAAPQDAQTGPISAPQPAQNRASSSLARPQDGQFLAMVLLRVRWAVGAQRHRTRFAPLDTGGVLWI
jgi:hypothetical protein